MAPLLRASGAVARAGAAAARTARPPVTAISRAHVIAPVCARELPPCCCCPPTSTPTLRAWPGRGPRRGRGAGGALPRACRHPRSVRRFLLCRARPSSSSLLTCAPLLAPAGGARRTAQRLRGSRSEGTCRHPRRGAVPRGPGPSCGVACAVARFRRRGVRPDGRASCGRGSAPCNAAHRAHLLHAVCAAAAAAVAREGGCRLSRRRCEAGRVPQKAQHARPRVRCGASRQEQSCLAARVRARGACAFPRPCLAACVVHTAADNLVVCAGGGWACVSGGCLVRGGWVGQCCGGWSRSATP